MANALSGGSARRWSDLVRPGAEWLLWMTIALIAYFQTSVFDQDIQEYDYGPTGWPRAVCIGLMLGATGQFLSNSLAIWRTGTKTTSETQQVRGRQALQQVMFFILPFVYLYLAARIGFYVATPFFIILMLLLLEIRSITTILLVTFCVFGIALLVFTRLFYVALPVGRIEILYDINNAIILLARLGL